jgi:hypothetical protein
MGRSRKGSHRKQKFRSPGDPSVPMSLEMLARALPARPEQRPIPVLALPLVSSATEEASTPPKVVWAPIVGCEVEGCGDFAIPSATAPASLSSGRPLPFRLCETHTLTYLTTHATESAGGMTTMQCDK